MADRFRFIAVFGMAMVLLSGVAIAAERENVPVDTAPVAEYVPQGNPLPDDPTADELLDRVYATTDAGIQRDRLELATRLAEIGPGGSNAMPGIEGIAASARGILVAVGRNVSMGDVEPLVTKALASILDAHPQLSGFGMVEYQVGELRITEQSTPGGW